MKKFFLLLLVVSILFLNLTGFTAVDSEQHSKKEAARKAADAWYQSMLAEVDETYPPKMPENIAVSYMDELPYPGWGWGLTATYEDYLNYKEKDNLPEDAPTDGLKGEFVFINKNSESHSNSLWSTVITSRDELDCFYATMYETTNAPSKYDRANYEKLAEIDYDQKTVLLLSICCEGLAEWITVEDLYVHKDDVIVRLQDQANKKTEYGATIWLAYAVEKADLPEEDFDIYCYVEQPNMEIGYSPERLDFVMFRVKFLHGADVVNAKICEEDFKKS